MSLLRESPRSRLSFLLNPSSDAIQSQYEALKGFSGKLTPGHSTEPRSGTFPGDAGREGERSEETGGGGTPKRSEAGFVIKNLPKFFWKISALFIILSSFYNLTTF